MNTAITIGAEGHLVPEETAIAMIESCAAQIEKAITIPDIQRVITSAEAINAVMKKIHASERAKRAATLLVIGAEQQLGRITKNIPRAKRGGAGKRGGGGPGKMTTLREHGINKFRYQVAEKLADTPTRDIEKAYEKSKSKTVSGVAVALGYRNDFANGRPTYSSLTQIERNIDFLANEAIDLLELGVKQQKPPPEGNVVEMRDRLNRLRVRK